MHIMQLNPKLLVPTDDLLHPAVRGHLSSLEHMAGYLSEGCLDSREYEEFVRPLGLPLVKRKGSVYTMPYLAPETCSMILRVASSLHYEANAAEKVEYQIPEVVLKHECMALHASLAVLFDLVMLPVAAILYGMEPTNLRSIQLAKYGPSTTGRGNWHTDRDSDFTVVVALSDTHEGGGTEVKGHGFADPFVVPQLPVGHAMIFPGKTHLHRGLPVTKGTRNLLVHWSEVK